uniref:Uncharacterized protein n=1 Tax=Kalanchoe fedtschenkoi TaxID=63787 RepID=A0A7N0UPK3_KALFE
MDIVNNVSNFFQDIFGVPETDKKPSDDASFLGATSPDIDADLNQHIGIVKLQDLNFFAKSENSSVGSSETHEIGTSISEILQTIKLTVIDIVNNVSNFIQDIFGVPETYKKPSYDASFSKASFIESTSLKASIRGLAIVVLSMAVLKRV